ncbi:MAG TPA: hypothetical protein VK489_07735 [Ferruginibacter sp.]|nr:hypothetical protein [Ferruginibacter sp.]
MKKILLLVTLTLPVLSVLAQDYTSIKTQVALQQYKKAREDVDKGMGNTKFASKAEAYILKAAIYGSLAAEPATKGTPAGDQLLSEADAAFKKYRELDPTLTLLSDPVYQNSPINIYSGLFSSGYKDYEKKSWQEGADKFKRVVEYSDLLISKKIITIAADTNSLLLAGITAENSKNNDDAAKYYGRIADMKLGGADYEGIYRFLVRHSFAKKDMTNFEKYKAIGVQLYPTSEFFTYDKADFAIGLEDDFNKKVKALEDLVAADPNNEKAYQLLGEVIYDTLNSRKEGAVQPGNAADLEKIMINAFAKSSSLKAGNEIPYLFTADHYINKSIKISDEKDAHAAAMKTRTKPGTPLSKDDIAKRDALDQQYVALLEAAREPYERAVAILAKKENMSRLDKQQYKKAVGYLGDIYGIKKSRTKGNPADQAKFAAEEKKWNDLYTSLK